jgi:amino acid transporter
MGRAFPIVLTDTDGDVLGLELKGDDENDYAIWGHSSSDDEEDDDGFLGISPRRPLLRTNNNNNQSTMNPDEIEGIDSNNTTIEVGSPPINQNSKKDLMNVNGGQEKTSNGEIEQGLGAGEPAAKRSVSAFRLAMMCYFLTCGGPFGIESAVEAAGPLMALIGVLVTPFLWSLPQALMSAELSLLSNENGGNVVWVQRAFGDFLGWVNAYNNIGSYLVTQATTVVLFVDYLPGNFSTWEAWLIKLSFVFCLMAVNIIGLSWVYRLSILFMVIILSPFVIETVMTPILGRFDPHTWFQRESFESADWGLYLSTVIWSFGGFDSLGSLAGEVKGGRKTYILGTFGVLPFNICSYLIPIAIGYSLKPDYTQWTSGYFTIVAYSVSSWLGVLMVTGSVVSNFGAVSSVATISRTIWAMGKARGNSRKMPSFVAWSWRRKKTNTVRPIAAILLVGTLTIVITFFPFNILVQLTMILRIVNLMLEYGALIRLRYSEPDTPRPFEVPGGKLVAWLLPLPSFLLCIALLATGSWEVVVTGIGFNVAVVVVYILFRLWKKGKARYRAWKKKKMVKEALVNS